MLHREHHHCGEENPIGHNYYKRRNKFEGSHYQSLHEQIKAFEERAEFDGLVSLPLLQTKKHANHHWSHQEDRKSAANEKSDNRDTEEQPVLVFDQGPSFLDAFHR